MSAPTPDALRATTATARALAQQQKRTIAQQRAAWIKVEAAKRKPLLRKRFDRAARDAAARGDTEARIEVTNERGEPSFAADCRALYALEKQLRLEGFMVYVRADREVGIGSDPGPSYDYLYLTASWEKKKK